MLKVFPQLADVRIDYQWGGMIGITANRFPQAGRLSQYPNVFYAQGYSGHGLNVTHWCARLLAEAIHAGHSKGLDVFQRRAAHDLSRWKSPALTAAGPRHVLVSPARIARLTTLTGAAGNSPVD